MPQTGCEHLMTLHVRTANSNFPRGVTWKSLTPLTGHANGGEQSHRCRYVLVILYVTILIGAACRFLFLGSFADRYKLLKCEENMHARPSLECMSKVCSDQMPSILHATSACHVFV